MNAAFRKAALIVSAFGIMGLPACTASDVFDSFDGFMVGIQCQLDAFFGANHCRPTGRLHRKAGASGYLDPSVFTLQFQAMGTDITAYPSSVTLTLWNNGSALASQTFALNVDSQGVATLADSAGAASWMNSYSASATDVSYDAGDTLTAPVYAGTNTISVDNVIAGTSVASSYWSSRYGTEFTPYPGPR